MAIELRHHRGSRSHTTYVKTRTSAFVVSPRVRRKNNRDSRNCSPRKPLGPFSLHLLTGITRLAIYKQANMPYLHNKQPPQRGGAIPDPVWIGSKWLLIFPRVPVTLGTQLAQTIFLSCCPLNDRRRAAHSFYTIGHLSFSCPSSSPHSSPPDERQPSS